MYVILPVNSCQPCPWNPRTIAPYCPDMQSLVESVRANGVLSPILVRPLGLLYQILAGERRWRAACAAGLSEIPAIVRDVDDKTAIEMTVTENLQRKDLLPLQEAAGVQSLLDAGWAIASIAERLGRSPQWVARRARLASLTPAWREAIGRDPIFAQWTVGHLEAVARLSPSSQDAALPMFAGRMFVPSIADVIARVTPERLDPSAAPWLEMETRTGFARPSGFSTCSTCPLRASQQDYLFSPEELLGDGGQRQRDRCLNPLCWNEKLAAFCEYKVDAARKKHGKKLVHICFDGKKLLDVEAVNAFNVEVVKKGGKGAVPAVCVSDCSQVGETVWVLLPEPKPGDDDKTEALNDATETTSKPAKKVGKAEEKKKRNAIHAFLGNLLEFWIDGETSPPVEIMLPLLVVYGVKSSQRFVYPDSHMIGHDNTEKSCRDSARLLFLPEHTELLRIGLWRLLCDIIDARFDSVTDSDVAEAWEEVEFLAPIVMNGKAANEFLSGNLDNGK